MFAISLPKQTKSLHKPSSTNFNSPIDFLKVPVFMEQGHTFKTK